jgi:hypothetical protein
MELRDGFSGFKAQIAGNSRSIAGICHLEAEEIQRQGRRARFAQPFQTAKRRLTYSTRYKNT